MKEYYNYNGWQDAIEELKGDHNCIVEDLREEWWKNTTPQRKSFEDEDIDNLPW